MQIQHLIRCFREPILATNIHSSVNKIKTSLFKDCRRFMRGHVLQTFFYMEQILAERCEVPVYSMKSYFYFIRASHATLPGVCKAPASHTTVFLQRTQAYEKCDVKVVQAVFLHGAGAPCYPGKLLLAHGLRPVPFPCIIVTVYSRRCMQCLYNGTSIINHYFLRLSAQSVSSVFHFFFTAYAIRPYKAL